MRYRRSLWTSLYPNAQIILTALLSLLGVIVLGIPWLLL